MVAISKTLPEFECTACGGTGLEEPDCKTCEGNGWVKDEEDGGTMTCPDCNSDKCTACGGTGEKPE